MLQLFSPAKINLFLRIINKRPDGYHNLSSLFQTIDFCDILTFDLNNEQKDILTCSDKTLATDETNLVLKATKLFREKSGIPIYLKIHLQKNIPLQAGLGGGSGNAATTLWGLNALTNSTIATSELMSWGAEIGSDVAFFLSHGTAYCTGRGEKIQEVSCLPKTIVTIVKPDVNLPTPAVYKELNVKYEEQVTNDFENILAGKIDYFNDLEPPAFKISPELFDLKQKLLSSGFHTVVLSGSGSSFFCLGDGDLDSRKNLMIFKTCFIQRNSHQWFKTRVI